MRPQSDDSATTCWGIAPLGASGTRLPAAMRADNSSITIRAADSTCEPPDNRPKRVREYKR